MNLLVYLTEKYFAFAVDESFQSEGLSLLNCGKRSPYSLSWDLLLDEIWICAISSIFLYFFSYFWSHCLLALNSSDFWTLSSKNSKLIFSLTYLVTQCQHWRGLFDLLLFILAGVILTSNNCFAFWLVFLVYGCNIKLAVVWVPMWRKEVRVQYSTKQLQPAVVENSVQFWHYLPGDQRQIPV